MTTNILAIALSIFIFVMFISIFFEDTINKIILNYLQHKPVKIKAVNNKNKSEIKHRTIIWIIDFIGIMAIGIIAKLFDFSIKDVIDLLK